MLILMRIMVYIGQSDSLAREVLKMGVNCVFYFESRDMSALRTGCSYYVPAKDIEIKECNHCFVKLSFQDARKIALERAATHK